METSPDVEPEPEPYRSEAADQARRVFDDADSKKREVENQIQKTEDWLKQDYGPEAEFLKLRDQCFSLNIRQYTYEVCPYSKAEQKESGHGTSLGSWKGFQDTSENTDIFPKLDPSQFFFKVMKFTDGQSCWQGPMRSLTVALKCGPSISLSQVEEPNKCVYSATLTLPSVCIEEHAKALRFNLEAGSLGHEEE